MCFTLLTGVATLVGGGMEAMGQSRAARGRASAMETQADLLERQAEQRGEVGAANLRELVRQSEEDIGTSRVAAAKSGVKVGAGSAGDTERKIRRDYRRTGERYSEDLAIEDENIRTEARLLRKGAGKVRRAGAFQALGTGATAAFKGGARLSEFDWDNFFGGGK